MPHKLVNFLVISKESKHHPSYKNFFINFPSTHIILFVLNTQHTYTKIQQTKILVTCQSFDVLFLFGLVWQYSSIQKNIVQVGSKSRLLTCSNNITLSLPSYTDSASKRELNFCNCCIFVHGYLKVT